jgi:diaminopimelate decarboxylase
MSSFARDAQGHATLCGARVADLLAQAGVQTPAYLYDLEGIRRGVQDLKRTFGDRKHLIAYAVKANGSGSIVRTVSEAGTGACLVSGGELKVALGVGIAPGDMVINGVAKADWEIDLAISQGLFAIQAESLEELERIAARAQTLAKPARVGFRINPGVEIDSHSHIATGHDAAKFGIPKRQVGMAFDRVDQHAALTCVGLSTHVGSMLPKPEAYLKSAATVCELGRARLAAGHALDYINFGGGYGISDGKVEASLPSEFVRAALELSEREGLAELRLVIEPGRSLVGSHGVLVAAIRQKKEGAERRWLMIDAGMNDLLRPALYGARHRIEPLELPVGRATEEAVQGAAKEWRVVGPICESSDDFGTHALGEPERHVVIRDTGAYGFSMASEYNGRALPSEVFVDGGKVVHTSKSPGVDAWVERRLRA